MASDELETPCPGCGKNTYPSEKPMLCLGTKWHPGCIKCTTCGITLSPRMMETYEKKPYCRAHRPDAKATATAAKDDFKVNQAITAPKAPRRQPGVDVTQRQTFYAGPGQNLDSVQKQLHQDKASVNPRGFVPDRPAAPNRTRAQGVNKLEGTTFTDNSMTNKSSSAPAATQSDWSAGVNQGHYDPSGQGGHDQGGYDQGGYDQGGYDQGGHEEQAYDQGGYEQGGHEQGGYDQGGYEQGGHEEQAYDQGGYEQGGHEEGGYEQGGYEQGGYEQGGYEGQEGYEQGGYEQGYEGQEGYEQGY